MAAPLRHRSELDAIATPADLPVARLALARRRAARRRTSAGAAMFVVAITLALLAAMGVYGLTATSLDIKAAGQVREGMLAQHAAENVAMVTAESMSPGVATSIVRALYQGSANGGAQACRTAKPYTSTSTENCVSEACVILTPDRLASIIATVNPTAAPAFAPAFAADSFGPGYPHRANVKVEVTDPAVVPPPPGVDYGSKVFVQVTMTIFSEMTVSATTPPASMVVARGRVTIGPVDVTETQCKR